MRNVYSTRRVREKEKKTKTRETGCGLSEWGAVGIQKIRYFHSLRPKQLNFEQRQPASSSSTASRQARSQSASQPASRGNRSASGSWLERAQRLEKNFGSQLESQLQSFESHLSLIRRLVYDCFSFGSIDRRPSRRSSRPIGVVQGIDSARESFDGR